MLILGMDISLDHAGFCTLNGEGEEEGYLYFTGVKKDYEACPSHSELLKVKRDPEEDIDSFRIRRVREFLDLFKKYYPILPWSDQEIYVSLEGYAYGAATNNIVQTSELVGPIKEIIYYKGGILRIHDPTSLKFFGAGKGNATKKEMVNAAVEEGFWCHAPCKQKTRKTKTKTYEDYDGPMTDVADAFHLARILWYELQLRKGEIIMKDLPEHKILAFNRVTKAYPVNILARPFIQEKK